MTKNLPDTRHHPLLFDERRFWRTLVVTLVAGGSLIWIATTGAAPSPGADARAEPLTISQARAVVVKSRRQLYLFDRGTLVRVYPITLGPNPTGPKRRAADGRTPEGRFRICSKNPLSPNHRFLGIDYPDSGLVQHSLASGLLTPGEAAAIARAQAEGSPPPWDTALGGGIGLHGGAPKQTAGCIALSDQHISELFNVLRIGDEVEILP